MAGTSRAKSGVAVGFNNRRSSRLVVASMAGSRHRILPKEGAKQRMDKGRLAWRRRVRKRTQYWGSWSSSNGSANSITSSRSGYNICTRVYRTALVVAPYGVTPRCRSSLLRTRSRYRMATRHASHVGSSRPLETVPKPPEATQWPRRWVPPRLACSKPRLPRCLHKCLPNANKSCSTTCHPRERSRKIRWAGDSPPPRQHRRSTPLNGNSYLKLAKTFTCL